MSDLVVIIPKVPVTDKTYVVSCWKCEETFDAASSRWCGCDGKLRTLECPRCRSCLCHAPFGYRRKFWSDAPKTLRENAIRFRVADPDGVTPDVALPMDSEADSRHPHVLIVDDEEPMRSLAACYVEQIGYRVTTVAGPEEALITAGTVSYDVVLTDALMPKMDGRELCRKLKEAHGNRIKVILMTSLYKARHYQNEAHHVFKVDECLAKPLRYGELRDALQRVAPLARGTADWNLALAD